MGAWNQNRLTGKLAIVCQTIPRFTFDEPVVSDIVFANAGIAEYGPFGEIIVELYDSIFNINVKGLLFTV